MLCCSGFCSKCAMQLEICPLCRNPIENIETVHATSSSTNTGSDIHLRSQLSHDSSTADRSSPASNLGCNDDCIK